MSLDRTIIIGAGDYGVVYFKYLKDACDADIVGFFDDDSEKQGREVAGIPVLGLVGDIGSFVSEIDSAIVAIGNNRVRLRILDKLHQLGIQTPNFVHPSVSMQTKLSENKAVYILPGSIIMPEVRFGRGVMVSTGVKVAHHTLLEDGVFLSQGASIGARIVVQTRAFVGMESVVVTGDNIVGADSTIGAGAVVISDVEAGSTIVGVPARPITRT